MRIRVDSRLRLDCRDEEFDLIPTLRDALTVETRSFITIRGRRRQTKKTYKMARGKGNQLVLPRGFRRELWEHIKDFGATVDDVADYRSDGEAIKVELGTDLRPYQRAAVETMLDEKDGVVCAPTGSGKTIMALGLIAELKCSTLVLVHTSSLLQQMAERMEQFLGITPGIIGGGQDNPGPITVATVQTMMRRPRNYLADDFGLVILDEAHHCPASTFRKVIQRFSARYRVGFTATPERKDGLHPMLYATVGPLAHKVDPDALRSGGSILQIEVLPVETSFHCKYKGDHTALIQKMADDEARNLTIVAAVGCHHRKRSLILTDRVKHAWHLAERLSSFGQKVACVTGETPHSQRDEAYRALESGELSMLVATTALVGEGFDCPALDAVFLTMPIGNVPRLTQVVGRILRPFPGKPVPRVIDFIDAQIPAMKRQFGVRKRVYRENIHPDHKAALRKGQRAGSQS